MIDPRLAIRIKKAWAALTPEQRAKVEPHLQFADSKLQSVLTTGAAPAEPVSRRVLLYAKSALEDATQVYALSSTRALEQSMSLGCKVPVDSSGNLLGFGTYQLLDSRWLEAGVLWLEYLAQQNRFPFGAAPPPRIPIPDKLTVVLAGDFGTGDWGSTTNPAASTRIRKQIAALNPEITIHLGDVYYAGTNGSELANFVSLWPKGTLGSLTLNSNHEMYTGGVAYFQEALGSAAFQMQGGRSFFALENSQWIIVGLDTAYFSDPYKLFMDGALSNGHDLDIQTPFLRDCANSGKKVLLLTHHNGLLEDGTGKCPLWPQVISAFPAGSPPALWYWGHAHAGVVYAPQASDKIPCRCIGHGALPWGKASSLANNNVSWFETRSANDPDDPQRVLNGYAVLTFDSGNVTETFYDENGKVAWP